MKKRLLSWLLSASMILSLAPNMVFTAGAVDNAWPEENFSGEATVTLSENKTDATPVTVENGAVLTIDGDGHSITDFTGTLFTVKEGGQLVLDDVTISDGKDCDNGAVLVETGGLLDLGYNDQSERKAPSITGNTDSDSNEKNLVVSEGAKVRLNNEPQAEIGVSYNGDIAVDAPQNVMMGGRYAIKGDNDTHESEETNIVSDDSKLEVFYANDHLVLALNGNKTLVWDPIQYWSNIEGSNTSYDTDIFNIIKDIQGEDNTTYINGSPSDPRHLTEDEIQNLQQYDMIVLNYPQIELNEDEIAALQEFVNNGGRIYMQFENPGGGSLRKPALEDGQIIAQALNASFTIDDQQYVAYKAPVEVNTEDERARRLGTADISAHDRSFMAAYIYSNSDSVTWLVKGETTMGNTSYIICDQFAGDKNGESWGSITVCGDGGYFDAEGGSYGRELLKAILQDSKRNRITAATGVNPNVTVESQATIGETEYPSVSAALAKATEPGSTVVVDSDKANNGELTPAENELFWKGTKLTTNDNTYTSLADGTKIDMDNQGNLTMRSGSIGLEANAPINVKVDGNVYNVKTSNGTTVQMPENNKPYVTLQGGESVTIDGVTYTVKDGESDVQVFIPNGFLNEDGSVVNNKIAKAEIADGKTAPVVIGKNEDGSFKTITATGAATITPDAPNAGDFSVKANTEITLPNGVKATVNKADCPTVWPADGQNPYVDVENQNTETTVKSGGVTYVVDANQSAKVYLPNGMTDEGVHKAEASKGTTVQIGNNTLTTGENNKDNIIVKRPDGPEKATITVLKKGDTFTWNGKKYTAEKDNQVFIVDKDGNIQTYEPKVIGKTSDSLTFEGKPGQNYKITKGNDEVPRENIKEIRPGVYEVTELEKDTEYKISHPQYGYTTARTSQATAEDIKNAFHPSENVEVGKDENGNYKITLKGDVEGVVVPDTWGDVTLDMNGHNIKGKDADKNEAAQPGIKFTHATNGAGTKLNVVGQGTIKGGDGSAKFPNGAEGITADSNTNNAELTIGKNVTVKGGNGATAENGNGGNGGSGIAGAVKPTVNGGTVIGGNGADGKDGESGSNGGNGGSGIKVDKDVAVNNGTVTGGNGGNGGAASGNKKPGGNGGNGGAGIDKDASGNVTINIGTGSKVTGGNGGQGGDADTGNGGNGGAGGAGTNNTTTADPNNGTVTGGNGGNAGMSDKGNNGNGGNGGQGGNGGSDGNQGGQPNYGDLSATTNTVTVTNPKTGHTYKLYDAAGNVVGTAVAEANKPLSFTGLKEGTEYTVKISPVGGREAEVGKITTQRHSSSGGGSSSYTIKVSAGNGGTISPSGNVTVARGKDQSFTIKTNKGYEIKDVLVDGKSVGAKSSYTFEKVMQAHTISVSFKKIVEEPIAGVADPKVTGVADTLETEKHNAYMRGRGNAKFAPDASMTRAEAAQMFYNLLLNKTADQNVKFTDVAATAWYSNAVSTLAARGVINGVGDNKFVPNRTITRAEFTAIAVRFAKSNAAADTKFADVSANAWYSGAVLTATSYGWITGYSDNTFRPQATITRAEVVTIVNRMLNRTADRNFVDHNAVAQFDDVSNTYWAYYNIMEATNAHDYSIDNDGVESWSKLK